jgi:hypothetical protein
MLCTDRTYSFSFPPPFSSALHIRGTKVTITTVRSYVSLAQELSVTLVKGIPGLGHPDAEKPPRHRASSGSCWPSEQAGQCLHHLRHRRPELGLRL